MQECEPRFVVDDGNRALLAALYDWAFGIKGVFDPQKGLLLHGKIGVGKSLLIKGLQRYRAKINRYCYAFENRSITFQMISAAEIALLFAEKGIAGITKFTDRECMCNLAIDELGREPLDSKHFGTGINVLQTVLQLRYEQRNKYFSHITTNLDPDKDFQNYYGDYIADRVKEMFNVVRIEGGSRR